MPGDASPTFTRVRVPPSPPEPPPGDANLPPALRRAVPFLIFFAAFLVLGTQLDAPDSVVFDEAHYVRWGREVAKGHLVENQGFGNITLQHMAINFEHPPLAKHLIAASLEATGKGQLDLTWDQYHIGCERAKKENGSDKQLDPPCSSGRAWDGCDHPNPACASEAAAWRLPSAFVGSLGIAFAYLLGLRLFHSVTAGLAASGFLILDTMWYLMSRMAMLDVFAAAFAVGGLAFALHRGPAARLAGALLFGLAIASKYTAIFLVPVFLFAYFARAPAGIPALRALYAVTLGLLVPLGVWVASYAPYFAQWAQIGGTSYAIGQFFVVQVAAAHWDFGADFEHGSASPPWSWIPQLEPTFYYYPTHPDFQPPLIYAVGNIAIWWPATLAALILPVALGVRAWRARDRSYRLWDRFRVQLRRPLVLTPRTALAAAALILLASYLPWFLLPRTSFNYYATFNAPFFALMAAGIFAYAWQRSLALRTAAAAHFLVAGALFALWWPIVSGADVPEAWFRLVYLILPWMST